MKKVNRKLVAVLAVMSILLGLAVYFDKLLVPAIVVGTVVSIFVTFIAMMQVFHYQEWWGDGNPANFWIAVSAVAAAILVLSTFTIGLSHVFEQLWMSIAAVCCPMVVPAIGVFLGNCGRVLKRESAIW